MITNKKTSTTVTEKKLSNEVKLFSDPSNSENLSFLKKIAPNSVMVNEIKRQTKENYINKKTEQIYENFGNFNKTALTKEELLEDCIKYNKVYIPINEYEGAFTLEDTKNIQQFCEDNQLALSEYDYHQKLYVLVDRSLNRIYDTTDRFVTKQISNPLFLIKYSDENTNGDIFFPIGNETKGFDMKAWFKGLTNLNQFTLSTAIGTSAGILSLVIGNLFFSYISLIIPFLFFYFGMGISIGLFKNYHNSGAFRRKFLYSYPQSFRDTTIYMALCTLFILVTYNITNNVSLLVRGGSAKYTHNKEKKLNSKSEVEKYGVKYENGKEYRVKWMYETEYNMGLFLPTKTKKIGETVYSVEQK
jgi:hypothetical protein